MGNTIKKFVKALLCSYITSAVILAILAYVLYKFRIGETQMQWGVWGIYGIACLLGGILMGKSKGNQRLIWGVLTGLLYFLILLLVSYIMNHGVADPSSEIFRAMGICVVSGAIGGILS